MYALKSHLWFIHCIMKRKFKQWWLFTILPISTKRKTTSHLNSLNTKKTRTCYVENNGPCLGYAHKCNAIKQVNVYFIYFQYFLICQGRSWQQGVVVKKLGFTEERHERWLVDGQLPYLKIHVEHTTCVIGWMLVA